jgi:translation initiation factor IF-3
MKAEWDYKNREIEEKGKQGRGCRISVCFNGRDAMCPEIIINYLDGLTEHLVVSFVN